MSHVDLNDENFQKEVEESSEPVLVDFWAAWCAPCRKLSPIVEELGETYKGKIKVAKLNVDDASSTAAKFGIKSIPTLILFKDGKVVDQLIGAAPKEQIRRLVRKHLA